MGNYLPLYKPQVKRKKKLVDDIRAFLLRVAINCNVNDVPADSERLKILFKQSNQFVVLLIDLFDCLQLIYKARHLGEKVVYKIEMIYFNIKDMGELLLVILRNVVLGEKYFNDGENEFKPVCKMFHKGVSELQHSFATIIQFTRNLTALVHPKTDLKHATNNALQKILNDVYRQLLILVNMFENFQEILESIKKKFYTVLEEAYRLTLLKIAAVGVGAFSIFTYALLGNLTIPWVILMSALCAMAVWHIANHLITTCPSKQLYDVFSDYDLKVNTLKSNGRIVPQDWFSKKSRVEVSKEKSLANLAGQEMAL